MNIPSVSIETSRLLEVISEELSIGILIRNPSRELIPFNEVMQEYLREFSDAGKFDIDDEYRAIRCIKDNKGKERYFHIILPPDASHQKIVLVREVTERIQKERKLEEEKHHAEYANRAKSEFLAKMCHEIRTPMNAISGASELMAETPLNSDQLQFNLILNRSSNLLINIINNMINFSKIETGHTQLMSVLFNPMELIETVTSLFFQKYHGNEIELITETDPNLTEEIRGDATKLKQVLINLIGNAFKFTKRGRITLSVKKTQFHPAYSDDTQLSLSFSVSDTGIGIPYEKQKMIFGMFGQVDPSAPYESGAGLGLAISKHFVEIMGGELKVESTPGSGSTFYFSLPFKKSPYRNEHAPHMKTPPDRAFRNNASDGIKKPPRFNYAIASPASMKRILLVEDYGYHRFVMRHFLSKFCLTVDEAETGIDAITAFQSVRYDLVLLDIQLPEMNGYDVIRKMRQFEEMKNYPSVWIIALSAHAFKEERQKILELGCNDFLPKPVKKKRLIHKIHRYLYSRQTADGSDSRMFIPVDPAMYKMAQLFLKEVKTLTLSLPDLIEKKNFEKIREEFHNIKGTAGGYGIVKISAMAGRIEAAAKNKDASRIAAQQKSLLGLLSSTQFSK